MTRSRIFVVAAALSAAACAHNKPVSALEQPTQREAAAPAPSPAPVAAAAAPAAPQPCQGDAQCGSRQLCISGACTDITPSLAACGVVRVHFDFDRDVLHESELPLLARAARCIEANEPAHVLITGNADERGTVEYNLALGERRADAVRRYFANMGVEPKRLELVTYGKELPLCTDHDEACWQLNRRAAIRPGDKATDISAMVKTDEAKEHAEPSGSAGGK